LTTLSPVTLELAKKGMKADCLLTMMGISLLVCLSTLASEMVTVDNFVRAETDMTFARYVKQGAFGKFLHIRQPTPIDKQDVIRMNRDTLYSAGIFDLTEPVTILKPDPAGRFQSMMVINQDHSMLPVEHGSGEFTLTRERVGTRYAIVLLRTFVDANDPADLKAASAMQDKVAVRQKHSGEFEIPDWDEASLKEVRDAINVLAATRTSAKGMFGDTAKLDPISHLLGTAYGWDGNPEEAAMYDNVVPARNEGKTPYRVTVKDVPVDGFWSITVYNKDGFMEKNDQDVHSYSNVTAKRNADGIKAAWVATLDMGNNAGGVSETTPYKPTPIARKSGVGWNKGTTVMLLDDAEGNTWILKGFQMGLKPQYTYEQFVAAGQSQFKKLPSGWKFRVKTLDRDLNEKPEGGMATIMADEFFNVYDKTGPGMSNYKP